MWALHILIPSILSYHEPVSDNGSVGIRYLRFMESAIVLHNAKKWRHAVFIGQEMVDLFILNNPINELIDTLWLGEDLRNFSRFHCYLEQAKMAQNVYLLTDYVGWYIM